MYAALSFHVEQHCFPGLFALSRKLALGRELFLIDDDELDTAIGRAAII